MKGFYLCFVLISLLILDVSTLNSKARLKQINNTIYYKPQNLSMLIPTTPSVIDPLNYINSTVANSNLTYTLNEINKLNNFTTYVIFISAMPANYTNISISNSSSFVAEIASILSQTNNRINLDSIIVIFSIQDHVIQMRTGADVRSIVTDQQIQDFIDAIKPILYTKDYASAATELGQLLLNQIEYSNTYSLSSLMDIPSDTLMIIIIVVCVVAAAIIVGLICFFLCRGFGGSLEGRLNRIKQVTSSEDNALQFIHENCTICLENLRDRNAMRNKLLECGHAYHKSCLETLNRVNKLSCVSCEYCKSIRDSTETGNTGFQRALVHIQAAIFNKQLNSYVINYRYGNFSFAKVKKNENETESKGLNKTNESARNTVNGNKESGINDRSQSDLNISKSHSNMTKV